MDKRIKDYIENHKEQIISDLCEIIKTPSVSDTRESKIMLKQIKELYEKNGFEVELQGDYLLSYMKNKGKSIGLFAHSDVVPAENNWTYGRPFEPTIVCNNIFGRGAADNKSGVIISLYALKLIRDLEIPFDSTLVCFTGSNEESTMNDIKSYVKTHTPPDLSLVLDAGFPVYLGDKGLLWLDCTLNEELEDLKDINGGNATNIILGSASARVKYTRELYDELKTHPELDACVSDNEILISAQGVSGHGATPNGTKNAGGMILKALLTANSFSLRDKNKLKLPCALLNEYDGTALGIKASDEIFGNTTVTNGILRVQNGKLCFTLDIRHGRAYTQRELLTGLGELFAKNNITYKVTKDGEPSYVSPENKFAVACMNAYREYTGKSDAMPAINAGSTYSRYLPCALETGTTLEYDGFDLPAGHGNVHQPDEHMSISGMLRALELVVNMLIECDKINK